ncbi:LytR/AlgR family response regulator transcription factor [Parasphingorhabdus cellanae]|uniref:Response regulator transcription factor n=1 Tax=Parasphingorhabdus cellanae TaxID=2806553 RepID=A0ABX7T6K7_9SPHN|nr:LytTR family DNA-binding domain-containing protein [Parasphingorhabdus cellanae]QTD57235.1 response regulator transcription factor [Parasphingorhabdus cellanae]
MTSDQKLDILIVDDEPLARGRIKSLCNRMTNINRIDMASGGREALDIISENCPAILLLDIDMPDLSGMDVAKRCQQLATAPEIIFTTAHDRYAVEAFRYDAADYLLKPVKEELLREAVSRVQQRRQTDQTGLQPTGDRRLWVQDGDSAVQISSADIGWIEADRDYMRLCLPDRSYLVHEAMQSLLKRLPPGLFVRIHRSAAVNRNYVRDIRRKGRRKYLVMQNGTELTIGPSFVKSAMSALGN